MVKAYNRNNARTFRMRGGASMAWLVVLGVVAVGCAPSPEPTASPATTSQKSAVPAAATGLDESTAKALAEFNRGSALIEQYRYPEAAEAFRSVLEMKPDWLAAEFNLGLALYNMQGEGNAKQSLEAARKAFADVLAADPGNLKAEFCLGLYHQYLGENEKALQQFKTVYEADPDAPRAAYKYAETLVATNQYDEATKVLEKVVAMDPGFVSAVYRLAQQYRRQKKLEEAKRLFERFQKLSQAELAGGSFAVQNTYGTVGKYYRLMGPDDLPLPPAREERSKPIVFSPDVATWPEPTRGWKWNGGAVGLAGLAVGDVDGDGDLDVFLAGTGKEDGGAAVWRNDGAGRFTATETLADHCVAGALGDVDNDGDLDLWIGHHQRHILMHSVKAGIIYHHRTTFYGLRHQLFTD